MKRLAFADDVGAPYDSMLAFPAAAGQFINGALDTVMCAAAGASALFAVRSRAFLLRSSRSITSRLLPWEVQSTSRPNSHNSFPGGEKMYLKYAGALQLHSIHFGEDMKASENMEFISQGSTNNALCFIGPHRRFDPFARGFYSLEPGQGHFGPDAIPGDARWRRGVRSPAPPRSPCDAVLTPLPLANAFRRASRSRRREIRWSRSSWPRRRR